MNLLTLGRGVANSLARAVAAHSVLRLSLVSHLRLEFFSLEN